MTREHLTAFLTKAKEDYDRARADIHADHKGPRHKLLFWQRQLRDHDDRRHDA